MINCNIFNYILLSLIALEFNTVVTVQSDKRELLNNDFGRRSSKGMAIAEQVEQEEELEFLAQSVVKEALKKVAQLKNESDKKEMLKLVEKFQDIIMALIGNHFEESLKVDSLPSDIDKENKEEINERRYNDIIDEVINQVVEIEDKKHEMNMEIKANQPDEKRMNAFEASHQVDNNLKPYKKDSDLENQLKGMKGVEKKYNIAGNVDGNAQKGPWVKYLVYNKNDHKGKSTIKNEPSKKSSDQAVKSVGDEEEELKGLESLPGKGMLESTKIKGGQVDFTDGKQNHQHGVLDHVTEPAEEDLDKKSGGPVPEEADDRDVYKLINRMISLLKHADKKEPSGA